MTARDVRRWRRWLVGGMWTAAALGGRVDAEPPLPAPAVLVAAPAPATTTASVAAPRAWVLSIPADGVAFHGSMNHDGAGLGTSQFIYPVPGVLGAVVALVAHGVVTSTLRDRQTARMTDEADHVLDPLRPALDQFSIERLGTGSLQRLPGHRIGRLRDASGPSATEWLIESRAVFSMSQDLRALVLDNDLRFFAPGSAVPASSRSVRVVSLPLPLPAPAAPAPAVAASAPDALALLAPLWIDAGGKRLADESEALFAESLDIALTDEESGFPDPGTVPRTYRYVQGGVVRMERAQLVRGGCERIVLRTLRGQLMSVPAPGASVVQDCAH